MNTGLSRVNDRPSKTQKKLRSYRFARIGCMGLAVISALVLVLLLSTGQTESESMIPAYASTFFWPALAYICHLKIQLLKIEPDGEDAR